MMAMPRVRCLLLVLTLDAGLAHAQARLLRIPSRILGEERSVHVALPSNYANARQRYQVTYLLDGHVRAFSIWRSQQRDTTSLVTSATTAFQRRSSSEWSTRIVARTSDAIRSSSLDFFTKS